MNRIRVLAFLSAAVMLLSGCGSSDSSSGGKKEKSSSSAVDTQKLDDMAGEYECTMVIVNFYASDAGVKSNEIDEKYKGSTIKLDGTILEMDGSSYQMDPKKHENQYYTYFVKIEESGYDGKPHNSDRKFAKEDFDGPVYFDFAKAGTDQGLDTPVAKDTIEMYYSPAGTTDWYYALTFEKK